MALRGEVEACSIYLLHGAMARLLIATLVNQYSQLADGCLALPG